MTQQEFERQWHDDSDFVTCHTSGSTGTPKEIHLEKEFMRESARRTNEFFQIASSSRLHTCLDFQYIASKMMAVRSDVAHCALTSETPTNRPLENVGDAEEITLLSVVPSQMEWLLDHPYRPGIRNILIGGAPIPSVLRRRIAMSGYSCWETYGMTETASHIALRRVVDDDSAPLETLPGITVSTTADGRLVINMPEIKNISTQDLAEVISDTSFRILGRADNCIISGGVKIIPEMLESLLGQFIAYEYCISSVEDKKWGERLVLAVENNSPYSDEILAKAVAVRLNQYKKELNLGVKAPKEIVCLKEFPRTHNGKLDRKAVKGKLAEKYGVR